MVGMKNEHIDMRLSKLGIAQSEECLSCTFVVTGLIPGEASILFILIRISKNANNKFILKIPALLMT